MVCHFFSAERAEKIQWTAACFIGFTIINTSETKRQGNHSNARLGNNTKETLAIETKKNGESDKQWCRVPDEKSTYRRIF